MLRTVLIISGFAIILMWNNIDVYAQSQAVGQCTQQEIQSANSAYSIGRFSKTFDALLPCLPDGFSAKDQRLRAWRLIALSYLAIDSLSAAERSVRSLLSVDKRFQPNPQSEPPLFVNLVYDLKPNWYTWPWRGGEWYKWAGRALIVGAAVSLPALLKKDDLAALPGPPENPIRN